MGQTDLSKDSNHNNQYDVLTFRSVSNLPTVNLQVILVPGQSDPGSTNGDQDEANLDLEWSGAVARNATLIYVNSKNALFTSLQYAVDQNLAPVISISYGLCEAQFSSSDIATLTSTGQQANAQGQTIVSSSGDSGPADCDFSSDPNNPVKSATQGYAVDVPASLPYVTGMGGTEFSEGDGTGATQYWNGTNNSNNGSAISYIPEMVWNDTAADGSSGCQWWRRQHALHQAFLADRRGRSRRWPTRCARSGAELLRRPRWLSHLLAQQLRNWVQKVRPDA